MNVGLNEYNTPAYPALGPTVQAWRRKAHNGIKSMPREQVVQYAQAVEKAILALQRSERQRVVAGRAPHCASGTAHTDGRKIAAAIRHRQAAALLAYPAKVRRERTPDKWQAMYDAAMQERRK